MSKLNLKTIAMSLAIVLILWLGYVIFYPVNPGTDIDVTISEGSTVKSIARLLSENKLIRSEYVFIVYVSALGEDRNLKAGNYIIPRGRNLNQVIDILSSGLSESDDIQITLPEGLNVWEIDKKLTDLGYVSESEFSALYYEDEGYLFPDTYRLKKIQNPKSEINPKIDIQELRKKMKDNFTAKTKELLKSEFNSKEVVIIASILEKEAKKEEDMKLVAGIIAKRMSLDMPLEIDASVTYGACARQSQENNYSKYCDVTFQGPAIEIKIDSPYNTYIQKGLPAGPISNPGLKAIRAALNPQPSDYLYYLSTRDGGEIIYSKTSVEHSANRRKYLRL